MPGYVNVGSGLTMWDVAEALRNVGEFHKVDLSVDMELRHPQERVLNVTISAVERADLSSEVPITRANSRRRWHFTAVSSQEDGQRFVNWLYRLILEMDGKLSLERWGQLNLPEG